MTACEGCNSFWWFQSLVLHLSRRKLNMIPQIQLLMDVLLEVQYQQKKRRAYMIWLSSWAEDRLANFYILNSYTAKIFFFLRFTFHFYICIFAFRCSLEKGFWLLQIIRVLTFCMYVWYFKENKRRGGNTLGVKLSEWVSFFEKCTAFQTYLVFMIGGLMNNL